VTVDIDRMKSAAGSAVQAAQAASYALLSDGSTVEIRAARPGDAQDIRQMHQHLSPGNAYLRFFSASPLAPEREAQRLCRPAAPDHASLLARLDGRLVGVASYEQTNQPGVAEIAFAVPDEMHGRGIATLLLEHLVSLARQGRLTAFAAETLPENYAMQRVFAAAGLPLQRHFADGVVELSMPLPDHDGDQLDHYLDAVAGRAGQADVASLRHLLVPSSVAVIGAGRRRGSAGREILHNIVTGGFAGPVYAVNPRDRSMEGLACLRSAADLPPGVDLAVIAVPPAAVPAVAAECGRRGVRALLVITASPGESGADLLAICRRYGMRLVGPDCLGVAAPAVRLNATFAAGQPAAGSAGLVVQSGGVGIALLEHLRRLGIGISSFASVGDKLDVSSNDLLTWWEQDGQTTMAVLYVESFGSPRGFARTARRVGRRMPVLTVVGGRSAAGQQAAAARTAAAATPLITQEALFSQAGIVATHSLGELVDVAALLSSQPLPPGRRIAIVSSAGGAGVLAADACADNALTIAVLSPGTRRRLAALLPAGAVVSGPVDTTAAVTVRGFRTCLEIVAADDSVDAVLAIGVPTAIADLTAAIRTARLTKPIAAVLLDQAESVILAGQPAGEGGLTGGAPRLPIYGFPENAARALGHAASYREWRDGEHGQVPELAGLDSAAGRAVIAAFLTGKPEGGWLPVADALAVLSSYQIPLVQAQPAIAGGVATLVKVVQEPVFGPLVVFGLAGVAADIPGDRAARLAPLTDADAAQLIRSVHGAPLLLGDRGPAAAGPAALADLLLRVSRLADDLPEIAELSLSPIIATPDGAYPLDARVKVRPASLGDPFLRQLR
jgi:acyl-CoA synthetase (NDP forming)/RimJ/RimL family protein N-acetyltransferase